MDQVMEILEHDKLRSSTKDQYSDLFWALKESNDDFRNLISQYVLKDCNITVDFQNFDDEMIFTVIPNQIWKIWELEFMLVLNDKSIDLTEKIYEIYLKWCDLIFMNLNWSKFLWVENLNGKSEENLYKNFQIYVQNLIFFLKSNH